MVYYHYYRSPAGLDDIMLESDGNTLTGVSFVKEKSNQESDLLIFAQASRWLNEYFDGRNPAFDIPYSLNGLTSFQRNVIELLLKIPYGECKSYSELKQMYLDRFHKDSMSDQAIGSAVGFNPIGIMIPCHRIIKKDGTIGGYAGGLDNKRYLLRLEGIKIKE